MSEDIYNARILDYAGNIERVGRLEQPCASAEAHSRLCGSTITVDINVHDDILTDYRHRVRACALGQAAASILARSIVGCHVDDLHALHKSLHAMLKQGGPPPEGRFADFALLAPVRDYKARHASTLLAIDAVIRALETIKAATARPHATLQA